MKTDKVMPNLGDKTNEFSLPAVGGDARICTAASHLGCTKPVKCFLRRKVVSSLLCNNSYYLLCSETSDI